MRPLPGDDAVRGRSSRTVDGDIPFGLPQGPPMSFFIGDESTAIPSSPQPSPTSFYRPKDVTPVSSSSSTRKNPTGPSEPAASHNPFSRHHHRLESRDSSTSRPSRNPKNLPDLLRHGDDPPSTPPMRPSAHTLMSPGGGPSGPASAAMSDISSRRGSFSGSLLDDMSSHAPSLYGGAVADEEGDPPASMLDSGSAPQLIMPSLKLPSRRPFTHEGKSMGRLKVLIAGDSGVGKTSLIKAIVQACEHIVHVDAITPTPVLRRHKSSPSSSSIGSGSGSRRQSAEMGTGKIAEIYASTKPYPEWWSEIDDFKVLQRRKSLGDAVLERNICFVDTPGYGSGSSVCLPIRCIAHDGC